MSIAAATPKSIFSLPRRWEMSTSTESAMSTHRMIHAAGPFALLLAVLCSCAPEPVDANEQPRRRGGNSEGQEGEGEEGEGEEGEGEEGEGEGEEAFTETVFATLDGVPTSFTVIVTADQNALGFQFDARSVDGHQFELHVERTPLTGDGPTDCSAVGLEYTDLSGESFGFYFSGVNEGCGVGFARLGTAEGDRITGTFFGTLPPLDLNGRTIIVTDGTFDLRLDEGL